MTWIAVLFGVVVVLALHAWWLRRAPRLVVGDDGSYGFFREFAEWYRSGAQLVLNSPHGNGAEIGLQLGPGDLRTLRVQFAGAGAPGAGELERAAELLRASGDRIVVQRDTDETVIELRNSELVDDDEFARLLGWILRAAGLCSGSTFTYKCTGEFDVEAAKRTTKRRYGN